MIEILEYNDERGRSPFRRWFNRLNHQAAARVAVALERMSEGNLGDVKSVGNGGWRGVSGVSDGLDGERLIILLGGGDKRRQLTLTTLTIVGKGIEMSNNSEHGASPTTEFRETVRDRAVVDADFRISLLETASEAIVSGDSGRRQSGAEALH